MYLCVYYCYIVFVNNYEFYWVSNKQTSTRKSITSVITDISINAGWFCLQWVNSTQPHKSTSHWTIKLFHNGGATAQVAQCYLIFCALLNFLFSCKYKALLLTSLFFVAGKYPGLPAAYPCSSVFSSTLLCYISYIMKIQLKPITSWVRQFSRWWMGSDLAKIIVALKESVCWSSN